MVAYGKCNCGVISSLSKQTLCIHCVIHIRIHISIGLTKILVYWKVRISGSWLHLYHFLLSDYSIRTYFYFYFARGEESLTGPAAPPRMSMSVTQAELWEKTITVTGVPGLVVPVLHRGVVVTTSDGMRWLVHKVIHSLEHLSQKTNL